jgi:hypothetical protein
VTRLVVAADGRTGRLVAELARLRGHDMRSPERLDGHRAAVAAVRGTDADELFSPGPLDKHTRLIRRTQ